MTHGFFLFPSLRALTVVSLSGEEFSSGIGKTTGEVQMKRKEQDGVQHCLAHYLLKTSMTRNQSTM